MERPRTTGKIRMAGQYLHIDDNQYNVITMTNTENTRTVLQ